MIQDFIKTLLTQEETRLRDAILQLEKDLQKFERLRDDSIRSGEALGAGFYKMNIRVTQEKLQRNRDRLTQLQSQNQNNMELKITKEKVREAAAKCPTADATLRTLFPEAFEEDKYFDLTKLVMEEGSIMKRSHWFLFDSDSERRAGTGYSEAIIYLFRDEQSSLFGKAFGLSRDLDWEIRKVNDRVLLIPTRKNK